MDVVANGGAEFYDLVCRGSEIDLWIYKHGFTGNSILNYVIIDDNEDFLPKQLPAFVKTNSRIGLTMEDADKCIEILNKNA